MALALLAQQAFVFGLFEKGS